MPRRSAKGYLRRHWLAFALGAFVILSEILILTQFSIDQPDISKKLQDSGQAQQTSRQIPFLAFTWVSIRARLLLFVRVNLFFVDRYHDTLNAVSTLAVAIFTATLWGTTKRLWIAGERQIDLIERNAKEQTANVNASLSLSRDIAYHQLRAYISLKEFRASPRVDASNEVIGWEISVVWQNTGSSATRDLLTHCSVFHEQKDIPPDYRFPDNWIDGRTMRYVPTYLAPQNTLSDLSFPISTFQLKEIQVNRRFFYIYGWAEYNDVFVGTPRHRTEFCARLTVPGDPHRPSERNIAFDVYPEHNGADDECMRQPQTTMNRRTITPLPDRPSAPVGG